MYNFWIDPQVPIEVEDIFFNYGSQHYIEQGDVLLSMHDNIDAYYFVADGLLAVLASSFSDTEYFIAKIIPESRTFGFSEFSRVNDNSYEIRALRTSVVYTISAVEMLTLIDEGYLDRRILNNYCRTVRSLDNKAASLVAVTNVHMRHIAVINSFKLHKPKYQVYNDIKELALTSDDMNGITELYTDYVQLIGVDDFATNKAFSISNGFVTNKKQDIKGVH